jgi:hypothetical protein
LKLNIVCIIILVGAYGYLQGQETPRWRSGAPQPFVVRSDIRQDGGRWDPDPLWVKIAWDPKSDKYFQPIRQEVATANSGAIDSDKNGVWAARARRAFTDWYKDHQNAEKLFRASAYLGTTTIVDTKFANSKEFRRLEADLNLGFSMIKQENTPPSYEFCRRAYIVKAGDTHYHRMRDLGLRLLKRQPLDRTVLISMVREYQQRGKDAAFEKAMFDGLFAVAKTIHWRYWDDQWIARAMRLYAQHHGKKSYYDKAISYLDRAIAKTPSGVDDSFIREFRALCVKEKDLPNFGLPVFDRTKYGG